MKKRGEQVCHRVVIVDDEPIIVEGISRLVPWKKYECSVCACAYSGKEGLEVVRREKPDMIFSDISMPGLDGLKMIAGLKSEFPDMQISILTGFRDFDYCSRAHAAWSDQICSESFKTGGIGRGALSYDI